MDSALAFLDAHAWLWPLLLGAAWAVVSALALTILDRWIPQTDDQWALLFTHQPKLAALAGMLKTAGLNAPGFFRWLRAFFAGPPPTLPMPKSVDELRALEATVLDQLAMAAKK